MCHMISEASWESDTLHQWLKLVENAISRQKEKV